MASMNESASTTASSAAHQNQAEDSTASSMPNITQLSLEHNPDIFTIICCNDSFQLSLDHSTIKTLLRVCRRARPLLSSKLPLFHGWCRKEGLCHPDGQMRVELTPSDEIVLSIHCEDPVKTSRSWLEYLVDNGNVAASYFLARILQVDLSGRQSLEKSKKQAIRQRIFRHLEIAANTSHTMSQFHLAGCYRNGLGVDQDHTKAVDMFRSLAECGMAQAQVALGRYYESGEGVDQDYNNAIEWYSKAADQGSDDGRLHIVFLRGWFSFIGLGVEQSDADAFNHWHEVSNLSTDPIIKSIATHMVGWMHYLGRGTQQNQQKGIKIIRDNKSDEFKLGEHECLAWLADECKSDSPTSCMFFKLCQLGSDQNWLCKHLMALCLVRGFGIMQDRKKAAGIFEQLANEGHSDSQLWIGECYCYGGGVTEDWTKSVEWYRKSAEQGNRYGQDRLGNCYQWGWGVLKDIDIAVFWYRKSADQGHEDAIFWLKQLGK